MKQIACSRSFACKHIVNLICKVIANLPYTGHVLAHRVDFARFAWIHSLLNYMASFLCWPFAKLAPTDTSRESSSGDARTIWWAWITKKASGTASESSDQLPGECPRHGNSRSFVFSCTRWVRIIIKPIVTAEAQVWRMSKHYRKPSH